MRPDLGVAAALFAVALGCSKESAPASGTAPSASTHAGAPAAAASPPSTGASPSSPAAPAVETWTGTYVSKVGSLYVFDGGEYAGVTWRGDEAGSGLGEGPISISVDRKTGTVQGTASGPIGDVVLTGALTGDTVTASVLRKDPLDRGLTGTAVVKPEGGKLVGSMRLSVANARVLREATISLQKASR